MNDNQKLYGYIVLKSKKFAFTIDGFIGRIFDGISGFRLNEKIKLNSNMFSLVSVAKIA